jgi:hypothetical protein
VCFSRFLSLLSSARTSCPMCPIFFSIVLLSASESKAAAALCSIGGLGSAGASVAVGTEVGRAEGSAWAHRKEPTLHSMSERDHRRTSSSAYRRLCRRDEFPLLPVPNHLMLPFSFTPHPEALSKNINAAPMRRAGVCFAPVGTTGLRARGTIRMLPQTGSSRAALLC